MRLWLIRHAKSSWTSRARSDFERPLNARGERDGPKIQAWLAQQAHPAEWIWTSDAARTLATAEFVSRAFPNATLMPDHRLYGASPETLIGVVRETPAQIHTAAIIAHNPGITWCINLLVGKRVLDNLPTFGVALLEWEGDAQALAAGSADLCILTSPKALPPE